MSRSLVFRCLSAAALGAAIWASLAWSPSRAADPAVRAEEELEHAMEQMNGCVKAWAKGIDAAGRDKALEQVAKFQSNVLTAKLLTPPDTDKVEEAKRAEYLAGFRKKLVDVLAASCQLENALIANDFDAANRTVKDLLHLKKEGHDAYQPEDEHGHGRR